MNTLSGTPKLTLPRRLAWRTLAQWLLGAALLLGVLLLNLWYLRHHALQQTEALLAAYTRSMQGQTRHLLLDTSQHLYLAGLRLEQLRAQQASDKRIDAMLHEELHGEFTPQDLWLLDADARVLWSKAPQTPGLNLGAQAFFPPQASTDGPELYVGPLPQHPGAERWQVALARALRNPDGSLRAVIVATMGLDQFTPLWPTPNLGEGGTVALLARDGRLLMRAPPDDALLGRSFADSALFQAELPRRAHGSFITTSVVDGQTRLYAYTTLDLPPSLVLVVGMHQNQALRAWWDMARTAVLICALAILAGAAMAYLLYRSRLQHAQAAEQARLALHALGAISQGVVISDAEGLTLSVNRAFEQLTGYGAAELIGRNCSLLQGPATDAATVEAIRQALRTPASIACELLNYRKDGSPFWNELAISPIHDEHGELSHFVGTHRDITHRKEATQALQLSERVLEQAHEGILVTDASGTILRVNPAFSAITGYTLADVAGRNPRILRSELQDPAFYTAMWAEIHAEGRWAGEIYNRKKDGTLFPEWLTITALHNDKGQVSHYVGSFSDLSDLKASQTRAHRLAHYDPLTNLPNTTLLHERAAHVITLAQRAQESVSLLMLSLDHLKNVNDTLGHETGDRILIEVASRLAEAVREQDTVAHMTGKEFALLLPDTASNGAAHVASALLWKLAQPYVSAGQDITLTACIGIATFPENGKDFVALLKCAEIALHRAQASGRDNYKFYSEGMYQEVVARERTIKALRTAAERDELHVLYQPLVDLQTGQISGMEALLRWHSPELGPIPPSQFIALAEETGLIGSIGRWVLRRVCSDIVAWRSTGLQPPHVAVNVSPLQFRDNDFVRMVTGVLQDHGLQPECIHLEVTESALIDDVQHCEQTLHTLKKMGFGLSLDDFGTGYSSLSYLKRYPFDKVKIDQSFVRDLGSDETDIVIVKVIISMAHGLGLKVIAEGVETEAQCEIMRTNVCDEIQGYFFSRPVDVQALQTLLADKRQLPAHLLRFRPPQRTLLIVDDEPNVVSSLKRLFRGPSLVILTAHSGQAGLDVLANAKVDVILSDQRMPGMTGVEFLREAKKRFPDTIRIMLSGFTELQSVTDAINEGAIYRFLTKPWDDNQLREQVRQAFEHMELVEQNRQLDIKIRATNQELIAANRHLGDLIESTKRQILAESTSLAVVREALQCVPTPIMGVDDQATIIFTNAAADEAFAAHAGALGSALHEFSPLLHQALQDSETGRIDAAEFGQRRWTVQWSAMGRYSPSRGVLLFFLPHEGAPT
ncbi:MAG: EAL domain-containing protein [Rhodoferax sp.]